MMGEKLWKSYHVNELVTSRIEFLEVNAGCAFSTRENLVQRILDRLDSFFLLIILFRINHALEALYLFSLSTHPISLVIIIFTSVELTGFVVHLI
jgi:hypothetical protein